MASQHIRAYSEIRESLLRGNPRLFRGEIIHILYKMCLATIKIAIHKLRDGEWAQTMEEPQDHRSESQMSGVTFAATEKLTDILTLFSDFTGDNSPSPLYAREIAYLEQFIIGLAKMPLECVRLAVGKDKKFNAIVSENYTVVVSQFVFEIFETFEKLKLKERDREATKSAIILDLLAQVRPHIKVADDLTLEAYVGSAYLSTHLPIEDTQKINAQTYYIGLLKDDLIYFTKLEDASRRKLNKDDFQAGPNPNMSQLLPPGIITTNPVVLGVPNVEVNPLGKREQPSSSSAGGLAAQNEMKKVQVEKSTATYMVSITEPSLASKIEYAKDYLDRKLIDKNNEPDIVKVALKDMPATVTVVETSQNAKAVLAGFSNGQVSGYFFSESEWTKYESEPRAPGSKSNLKNILDTDPEDVVKSLTACKFIGHSGAISCISINYDTNYFVTGATDGTVRLWNLRVGECLAVFKAHTKPVWTVSICPKGFYFASGGADSLIYLWITSKSTPVMCFNQHEADITHLEFTESLNYLVSASHDRSLRVWNLDDASLVRIIFFPEVIKKFKLTMNADIVVCGGEEGTVFVWDLLRAVKLHQFSLGKEPSPIMSIKLSIDERFFVISSKSRCLYFLTTALTQPRSKSAYEYLLSRLTVAERKLTGWEELSLNGVDITHKERILAAQATSTNQIYLVVVEMPN